MYTSCILCVIEAKAESREIERSSYLSQEILRNYKTDIACSMPKAPKSLCGRKQCYSPSDRPVTDSEKEKYSAKVGITYSYAMMETSFYFVVGI